MTLLDGTGQKGLAPKGKGISIMELGDLLKKGKYGRSRFESIWYLNLAYYAGQQWLYWNRGRLMEPNLEPWRVTYTDNRIIGIVRTEVSKLTKQRPVFVATPTTSDDADVSNAKLAERLLTYLWGHLDLQRKQRSALNWSRICGVGFWKIYWDSTKGDSFEIVLDQDGQPLQGPNGGPIRSDEMPQEFEQIKEQAGLQTKTLHMGEVCVEVKSPWELVVDPLCGDEGLESAEWLVEQTVKSKDSIVRRYGDKAKELKEDADAVGGIAESRMNFGYNPEGGSSYRGVRIQEFWAKTSARWPKGKHVVWAQETILVDEDNPYDCLPYVMFTGIPVPGRFYPTCVVEQLRPLNSEFNKTRSQIRENMARIGNPAVLISRYSNVDYHGVPGEVIEFDDTMPNSVPQYLQAPEMPVYVREEPAQIESGFREISGQHEVTNGQVPAGVTAASAINLLQEQDDTRLATDVYDMERSISQAGQLILKMVAAYYEEGRTGKIAGEDGDWDFVSFRKQALTSGAHVEVQAGSAFPRSKAAKQAAMADLLQLFIQNQVPMSRRELAKYLRDMEVGGFERLIDQFSDSEQQINRENRLIITGNQGRPLALNSYDDDEDHVNGHESFQRSGRYQEVIAANPVIAQLAEQHVQGHRDRMNQAQQAQMQAQVQQEAGPNVEVEKVKAQSAQQVAQMQSQVQLATQEQQSKLKQAEAAAQIQLDTMKADNDAKLKEKDAQLQLVIKAKDAEQQREIEAAKAHLELELERQKAQVQIELEKAKAAAQLELEKQKLEMQLQVERVKGDEARKTAEVQAKNQQTQEQVKGQEARKTAQAAPKPTPRSPSGN